VDVLIPAIGQEPDLAWNSSREGDGAIETARGGTCAVNEGLATSRPGVFAAGDFALGPATVVQAVGQGNRVAAAVAHYLRTGKSELVAVKPAYEAVEQKFDLEQYAQAKRPQAREIPVAKRRGNFDEVELLLSEQTIREECKRCLRCDLEWLQATGLAQEPMPERLLLAEGLALEAGPGRDA